MTPSADEVHPAQSVIILLQISHASLSKFTNSPAVLHVRQLFEASHVAHVGLLEHSAWFETTNNSARVKNKMMFFWV